MDRAPAAPRGRVVISAQMRAEDLARIRTLLSVVAAADAPRWYIEIPGAPMPWRRAGVFVMQGRNPKPRIFTSVESEAAKKLVADAFITINPRPVSPTNLALVCIFYRPDRRVMDLDNLEKLVMDAGTRARVWFDDCQITAKIAAIELDPDRPRTVIGIAVTRSTLDRTIPPKRQATAFLPKRRRAR